MKKLIFIFLFLQMSLHAFAQTKLVDWYESHELVFCREFDKYEDASMGRDVSYDKCVSSDNPIEFKWRRHGKYPNYAVFCTGYTSDGRVINELRLADMNKCRATDPTYPDWYKNEFGYTSCGEHTMSEGWIVQDLSKSDCRKGTGIQIAYDKKNKIEESIDQAKVKSLSIAEINNLLQVAEGSQVIIAADVTIPSKASRAAVQAARGNVQCYIGQKEMSHNLTLYQTKDEIIQIGKIRMSDDRIDILIELLDADDLGSILCRPKNNSVTRILNLDDLIKALEDSGIRFKDPGLLVKKLNRTHSVQSVEGN